MIITEDDRESARAMVAIWRGDFERGMAALDVVNAREIAVKNLAALHSPVWRGESLEGKAIMVVTQTAGHGDALQHGRFLPALKRRGAKVILCCHYSQANLFAESDGIDQVIMASLEEPCSAWGHPEIWPHDYYVRIDSLPVVLGTTLSTIPSAPYLKPSEEAIARWRPVLEAISGLRVGIYYQGNPEHGDDRRRSFRLAEFAPLAKIPGVSLISLQKGAGVEQLRDVGFPVVDLGSDYADGDWLETAGVVHHLDLVIGPDSALGHLAGGMGRPAWLALPEPSEYRWFRNRPDSPWYPTMALYRQSTPGVWSNVFWRMADTLRQRLAGSPKLCRACTNLSEPGESQMSDVGSTLENHHVCDED
jgi:hypothetical protein